MADDTGLLAEIQGHVAHPPTYGYRRVWALLSRSREQTGAPRINAKRVSGSCVSISCCCAAPACGETSGSMTVALPWTAAPRWCSDGFEFRCDDGTPLRVTCAPDCCGREVISWAATTGGHSGDVVRDVMQAAVEQHSGTTQAAQPIEWLTCISRNSI